MLALDDYIGRLHETWNRSGIFGWLLVLTWLLYPVAVVTVFHTSDAIGLQAWLQGIAIPRLVTRRMWNVGIGEAVFALAMLSLIQLVLVVLIYRRTKIRVHLWPLAALLVGGISNGVWWLKTGTFDPSGAMAGLSPVIAAVIWHGVSERLGDEFVFGHAQKHEAYGGEDFTPWEN